jgi:hypothetical protein
MLALCTAVTFLRLFIRAYSNAYCAVRSDLSYVMTCGVEVWTRRCGVWTHTPSGAQRLVVRDDLRCGGWVVLDGLLGITTVMVCRLWCGLRCVCVRVCAVRSGLSYVMTCGVEV